MVFKIGKLLFVIQIFFFCSLSLPLSSVTATTDWNVGKEFTHFHYEFYHKEDALLFTLKEPVHLERSETLDFQVRVNSVVNSDWGRQGTYTYIDANGVYDSVSTGSPACILELEANTISFGPKMEYIVDSDYRIDKLVDLWFRPVSYDRYFVYPEWFKANGPEGYLQRYMWNSSASSYSSHFSYDFGDIFGNVTGVKFMGISLTNPNEPVQYLEEHSSIHKWWWEIDASEKLWYDRDATYYYDSSIPGDKNTNWGLYSKFVLSVIVEYSEQGTLLEIRSDIEANSPDRNLTQSYWLYNDSIKDKENSTDSQVYWDTGAFFLGIIGCVIFVFRKKRDNS